MRSIAGLVVVAALLAGCASDTRQNLEARLAPLVGLPETELTRRLGRPSSVAELAGQRTIVYFEAWTLQGGQNGGTPYEQPPGRFCEISFTAAQGKVLAYSLRGVTCGWGGRPFILPA